MGVIKPIEDLESPQTPPKDPDQPEYTLNKERSKWKCKLLKTLMKLMLLVSIVVIASVSWASLGQRTMWKYTTQTTTYRPTQIITWEKVNVDIPTTGCLQTSNTSAACHTNRTLWRRNFLLMFLHELDISKLNITKPDCTRSGWIGFQSQCKLLEDPPQLTSSKWQWQSLIQLWVRSDTMENTKSCVTHTFGYGEGKLNLILKCTDSDDAEPTLSCSEIQVEGQTVTGLSLDQRRHRTVFSNCSCINNNQSTTWECQRESWFPGQEGISPWPQKTTNQSFTTFSFPPSYVHETLDLLQHIKPDLLTPLQQIRIPKRERRSLITEVQEQTCKYCALKPESLHSEGFNWTLFVTYSDTPLWIAQGQTLHVHTQDNAHFEHYMWVPDYKNINVITWHQRKLPIWERKLAFCLRNSKGEGTDMWPKWRVQGTQKGRHKCEGDKGCGLWESSSIMENMQEMIMYYSEINGHPRTNGPGGDIEWLKNLTTCIQQNQNRSGTPFEQKMEKYWSNQIVGLIGEWNASREGSIALPYISVRDNTKELIYRLLVSETTWWPHSLWQNPGKIPGLKYGYYKEVDSHSQPGDFWYSYNYLTKQTPRTK